MCVLEKSGWRHIVAILAPVVIVWSAWLPYMVETNSWHYFVARAQSSASESLPAVLNGTSNISTTLSMINTTVTTEHQKTNQSHGYPYYALSITMVFGSLVAGATSEGGASVAFPIMTLLLGIKPFIARVSDRHCLISEYKYAPLFKRVLAHMDQLLTATLLCLFSLFPFSP